MRTSLCYFLFLSHTHTHAAVWIECRKGAHKKSNKIVSILYPLCFKYSYRISNVQLAYTTHIMARVIVYWRNSTCLGYAGWCVCVFFSFSPPLAEHIILLILFWFLFWFVCLASSHSWCSFLYYTVFSYIFPPTLFVSLSSVCDCNSCTHWAKEKKNPREQYKNHSLE